MSRALETLMLQLVFLVAPKDVQLMTRRDDLELSHGMPAKARENAVKQDRVQATNERCQTNWIGTEEPAIQASQAAS